MPFLSYRYWVAAYQLCLYSSWSTCSSSNFQVRHHLTPHQNLYSPHQWILWLRTGSFSRSNTTTCSTTVPSQQWYGSIAAIGTFWDLTVLKLQILTSSSVSWTIAYPCRFLVSMTEPDIWWSLRALQAKNLQSFEPDAKLYPCR